MLRLFLQNVIGVYLFWTLLFQVQVSAASGGQCSNVTCRLPECQCVSMVPPAGLRPSDAPQFVLISVDDGITVELYEYYAEIFHQTYRNPDGSPCRGTFFLSGEWPTFDYNPARELHRFGHAIGSHSQTHRFPIPWWSTATRDDIIEEFDGMRQKLVEFGSIPEEYIISTRNPFLQPNTDTFFEALRSKGFTIDSSFLSSVHYPSWPFTLDYIPSPAGISVIAPIPKVSYPGYWEIPLVQLETKEEGTLCGMLDDCRESTPETKAELLKMLNHNFNERYNGNRAPLSLGLHGNFLKKTEFRQALATFVREKSQKQDTWFITIPDMVEWSRQPTSWSQLKRNPPPQWNKRFPYRYGDPSIASGTNSEVFVIVIVLSFSHLML